ncbi:MAG: hypothetical protein AAB281_02375 [Actinomycetota bacterium]
MQTVNVKELTVQNRARRHRRLELLRKSVENHDYKVEPVQVASGMIHEASLDAALRTPAE